VELLRTEDDERVVTNSVSNGRGEFRFNAPVPGQYLLRAVAADDPVLFACASAAGRLAAQRIA